MELHRMFRVPRTGGLETKLIVCPGSMQFGVKEEAAEVNDLHSNMKYCDSSIFVRIEDRGIGFRCFNLSCCRICPKGI